MADQHLSDDQLLGLLREDQSGDEWNAVQRHLDICETCRKRLEALAASPWWWNDGRQWVASSVAISDARNVQAIHKLSSAASDLPETVSVETIGGGDLRFDELLEAPTHPELMGRLAHYDIESVIGRGGMGVVFQGFDRQLHRVVAIKMLLPHLASLAAARKRFLNEARAAAAVRNEHIVEIYEVCSNGRFPYIVLEYISGSSLQELVEADGPLSAIDVARIGNQIARGLAAAHRMGLVHRDIKPANILVNESRTHAYITDFGLAKAADDASLTHTGFIAGTPHYMAPEQCQGMPADASADLFALGGVLYFMTTGHPAFRAQNAMAVMHRVCHSSHRSVYQVVAETPRPLSRIIDRLLAKNPIARYPDAEQVADVLQELLLHLRDPKQCACPPVDRVRRRSFPKLTFKIAVGIGVLATVITALSLFFWMSPAWRNGNGGPAGKDSQPSVVKLELGKLSEALAGASSKSERLALVEAFKRDLEAQGISPQFSKRDAPKALRFGLSSDASDWIPSASDWMPSASDWIPSAGDDSHASAGQRFANGIANFHASEFEQAEEDFRASLIDSTRSGGIDAVQSVRARIWLLKTAQMLGNEVDDTEFQAIKVLLEKNEFPQDVTTAWAWVAE
ncbi:MAG: serine/threonine-protein kinase [Planctomycetota bacterium]